MPNVLTTTHNVQDSHSSDWDMYVAYWTAIQQLGPPPLSSPPSTNFINNYINNSSVNIDYDSDSSNDSYYDSMPPLMDDNNDNDLYDDDSDSEFALSDPPTVDLHSKQNALLP